MSAQPETKKRLALAIIDFLSTSLKDGTISAEDAESVEVAQSCIADTFHVDANDKKAMQDAIGNQSLLSIYSVYEKLAAAKKPTDTSATSSSAAPKQSNAEAEAFKSKGNAAMQQKNYADAIELYSKAINLDPTNPIYLSNRAAAYSASHQHAQASSDAELAVASDPKYTKAWSRLGLARFALGDAKGSMEAYQKGIEYEGNGGSDAMKKGLETAKRKVEQEGNLDLDEDDEDEAPRGGPGGAGGMPDLSSLAGMLGGGRGGGGPDLSSIMNNPMFASMAQNLMSNPDMMNNIMNNPGLRQMAEQFGGGGGGQGGGGMPDIGSLMSDPSIAEMARNLMGGAGGRGRGAPQ